MINLSSLLGGGMLLKQQLITSDTTWVRPSRMAGDTVWVTMIGGGSSGRTGSPVLGGVGGQYVIKFPINIGSTVNIPSTVGQGGAQGSTGVTNSGGPTSFGTFLTVVGGNTVTGQGGALGGSSATNSVVTGQDTPLGFGGRVITTTGGRVGGGGGLVLDDSQIQAGGLVDQVLGAKGYGAGGGAGAAGYAGAPGAILVEWPEFV